MTWRLIETTKFARNLGLSMRNKHATNCGHLLCTREQPATESFHAFEARRQVSERKIRLKIGFDGKVQPQLCQEEVSMLTVEAEQLQSTKMQDSRILGMSDVSEQLFPSTPVQQLVSS